jgi:hypothetical protein
VTISPCAGGLLQSGREAAILARRPISIESDIYGASVPDLPRATLTCRKKVTGETPT